MKLLNQVFATLILALSLIVCGYECLVFAAASMPYQDSTPELLYEQAEKVGIAQLVVFVSGTVAVDSLLWLCRGCAH